MLFRRLFAKPLFSFHHLMELLRIHVRDHVCPDLHELYHIHEIIDGRTRGDHGDVAGVDDGSDTAVLIA